MRTCLIIITAVFFLGLGFLPAHPLQAIQVEPDVLSVPKVEYTSEILRDPFRSPFEALSSPLDEVPVEVGLSHLTVQGMVWDSAMPQAIINNQVVKIGEVISEAKILDIRKEGVYVLYENKRCILRPRKR